MNPNVVCGPKSDASKSDVYYGQHKPIFSNSFPKADIMMYGQHRIRKTNKQNKIKIWSEFLSCIGKINKTNNKCTCRLAVGTAYCNRYNAYPPARYVVSRDMTKPETNRQLNWQAVRQTDWQASRQAGRKAGWKKYDKYRKKSEM